MLLNASEQHLLIRGERLRNKGSSLVDNLFYARGGKAASGGTEMSCPRCETYDEAIARQDAALTQEGIVLDSSDSTKYKVPAVLRQGSATMRRLVITYLPASVQKAVVTPKSVSLPYASAFQSIAPISLHLLGAILIMVALLVFLLALAIGAYLGACKLGVLEMRPWASFASLPVRGVAASRPLLCYDGDTQCCSIGETGWTSSNLRSMRSA